MKTENWKKVRLGDILLIQKKSKIKASDGIENGIYPFFTCSNDIVRTYNSAQYKGPALIFGTGGKASVHFCDTEFSTSTDCLTYYPVSSEINLDLVNQYIQSNIYLLENGFKGAGLKHVSRDYIANIEINLPDIKTQNCIVQKLNKAKNIISNSKKLLTKYDTLIKSRFIEMFGDIIQNTKNWELKSFTEIAKSRLGKMLDSKKQTGKEKYPYLANFNVQWFRFNLENLNEMDFSEADRIEFALKDGDLLVCEGGEVGRCAVWHNQIENCFFQKAVHRVRLNMDLVHPDYMAYWFKFRSDFNSFDDIVGSKATIAHLTGEKLKLLQIPVPPLSLQNDFASFVQQIDKSKFTVQKSLEKAETLYKSLMQQYFA